MTDGTTGIHVAPITEDDMSRVHSILKRAADAIVGMSQLTADVDMLRQTVASLQADADRLRSQNNALDEALNHSRSVRDEQGRKLADTFALLDQTEATRHDLSIQVERLNQTNDQLVVDLEAARKAKDDAEFRVLELEDKLAAAENRLSEVQSHIYDMTLLLKPKEKAPEPEPIKAELEYSKAASDYDALHAEPPTLVDTRPDSLDQWEPGYIWDQATMKYWREGVTPRSDGEAIPF